MKRAHQFVLLSNSEILKHPEDQKYLTQNISSLIFG